MNFFKRATTSIVRRPGKSIILLLLVFILGTVIAGAISVEAAISNTDANLRAGMPPIVTIGNNWIAHDEFWQEISEEINADESNQNLSEEERDRLMRETMRELTADYEMIVTAELVRTIGALPHVRYYDYVITSQMRSFDLVRYEGEQTGMWRDEGWPAHFDLIGVSRSEIVHIEQGIIDLYQGRLFHEAELELGGDASRSVAIVSDVWADANDLSLNSTFTLYEYIDYPTEDEFGGGMWEFDFDNIYETVEFEFEIIGIFTVAEEMIENPITNEDWDLQWRQQNTLNAIYIPNWAAESFQTQVDEAFESRWDAVDFDNPWAEEFEAAAEEEMETSVIPLFVLNDAREVNDFMAASENYLPMFHEFEDLSSSFDDIASSMDTLQSIAFWILWVSVGATLLILSLLITLFLRDRRYEMGVYLALGEKKGRIVSQILMEVVVIALVGITLAVFAGSLISSTMSRNMLQSELTAQTDQDHSFSVGGSAFDWIGIPTTSMDADEMIAAFEVSLSLETVGLFYLVGLGAVVLSTMIPVLYVVTLNPKKVLL